VCFFLLYVHARNTYTHLCVRRPNTLPIYMHTLAGIRTHQCVIDVFEDPKPLLNMHVIPTHIYVFEDLIPYLCTCTPWQVFELIVLGTY
jgi:hypothetical protein